MAVARRCPAAVPRRTVLAREKQVWLWLAIATLAAAGCAVLGVWINALVREELVEARLGSPDPEIRQRAAWSAADERYEECLAIVRNSVRDGIERDPQVLEAFVYSLGLVRAASDWDIVAPLAESHAEGLIRQAAWLAAARIDPDRCAIVLERTPPPRDDWDRLGRANAQCQLGRDGGVATLLALARNGTDSQRIIASRSIAKFVKPALEALGRWPLDLEAPIGSAWRADELDQIASRCSVAGLGPVMSVAQTAESRSREIRRKQSKLTRARERIARVLFPSR